MMEDLLPLVKAQWEKINSQLKAPVIYKDQTIVNKLLNYWNKIKDLSNGRMNNNKKKEELLVQLDKLLDLTCCRCPIIT